MPEVNLAVMYWHIESEFDMTPIVKELLPHGYTGNITGTMQAPFGSDVEAELWLLSLVAGGLSLSAGIGDVVVWNGFAAQVMSRADFDGMVTPGA